VRSENIDRVADRAHSMKSSATGLNVRFFKVKIATGLVCTPRSIGKRLIVGRFAFKTWSIQAGITVKYSPVVGNMSRK
jgi:hypothetical protein